MPAEDALAYAVVAQVQVRYNVRAAVIRQNTGALTRGIVWVQKIVLCLATQFQKDHQKYATHQLKIAIQPVRHVQEA